jgi:molybdopterin converting factor small subunit
VIRVELPTHLRNLAKVSDTEVTVEVSGTAVTLEAVLDALEARYPVLGGTIRDHGTKKRRAFLRFFACGQDISNDPPSNPLPAAIAEGKEALLVVGAIAGGH